MGNVSNEKIEVHGGPDLRIASIDGLAESKKNMNDAQRHLEAIVALVAKFDTAVVHVKNSDKPVHVVNVGAVVEADQVHDSLRIARFEPIEIKNNTLTYKTDFNGSANLALFLYEVTGVEAGEPYADQDGHILAPAGHG